MPVPQNPARLPEAFWTKGSWHRQDSKRQRCLWAIPWKLKPSQNSLESESREAASEHFVSHSCCWPLYFIIFEKLFFPPEYFHLCLLVISRRITERLREGWTLIPLPTPWCSLLCLLSLHHRLLMSMVLAAGHFLLHFTEVWGEILIEKLNKIPHKMVSPNEHSTWKRQTSGCLELKAWFFFPIRHPQSLSLPWLVISSSEN